MKQLLLLFACFSVTIRLVSADCDEIHIAKGPTGGSQYNIEVYYIDREHHRKFILLNRNPYDVHVYYTVGGERRTRMINANKCEDFLGHGYCKVLSKKGSLAFKRYQGAEWNPTLPGKQNPFYVNSVRF